MTEHPEKATFTLPSAPETPPSVPEEHRFGDSAKEGSTEKDAEDEAAEQLGNFA